MKTAIGLQYVAAWTLGLLAMAGAVCDRDTAARAAETPAPQTAGAGRVLPLAVRHDGFTGYYPRPPLTRQMLE